MEPTLHPRSEPSLVGEGSEAGEGPGLMTSPKQGATQKLRPVLPGHPGMLSEEDVYGSLAQWYPFVKAVAIKGPAMPWPKPEPGCGLAALM